MSTPTAPVQAQSLHWAFDRVQDFMRVQAHCTPDELKNALQLLLLSVGIDGDLILVLARRYEQLARGGHKGGRASALLGLLIAFLAIEHARQKSSDC
jgi:hypothetical protein